MEINDPPVQLVLMNELRGTRNYYGCGTKTTISKNNILTNNKHVWQVSSAFRFKYLSNGAPTMITNFDDWCNMGLLFVYNRRLDTLYGTMNVIEVPKDSRITNSEIINTPIKLEPFKSYFGYNSFELMHYPEDYTFSEYHFDNTMVGLSNFKRNLNSHFIRSIIGEWDLIVKVLVVEHAVYVKHKTRYRTYVSKPKGCVLPLPSCQLNSLIFSDGSSYFVLSSEEGFKATYCLVNNLEYINVISHLLFSIDHQISMRQIHLPNLPSSLILGDRDVTI